MLTTVKYSFQEISTLAIYNACSRWDHIRYCLIIIQYRLWSGYDHPTTLCSGKTFFHFKVIGFKDCRVRFQICRTNLLNQLYKVRQIVIQNGQTEHYRPVYRLEGSNTYHRIKEQIKITVQINR